MADTFQFEIVTPEKLVVRDVAEEMQIPGKNGYLGILPGHAPLITELGVGEISYRVGGYTHRLAVAWGFAEVLPDKVTILAETAERAEEIDVKRAGEAKRRAEERLKSGNPEIDFDRAHVALERADARLEVAGKTQANPHS
jgi:F-type H+-transporting ATPase subunit epsilon